MQPDARTLTLPCPKCKAEMRTVERNGIHIETCPECRGIFLDRGELDRLLDLEAAALRPASAASAPPADLPARAGGDPIGDPSLADPYAGSGAPYRREEPYGRDEAYRRDDRFRGRERDGAGWDDDDDDDDDRYDRRGRRRGGFLSDLLDGFGD